MNSPATTDPWPPAATSPAGPRVVARLHSLVRRVAERVRPLADRVTGWLRGRHADSPGEARTVALFLRLMGLVYVAAFISLWVQVSGLLGSDGILPAREYLAAARSQLGAGRLWYVPTVLWLGSTDAALHLLCAAGTLCALLAVVGLVPVGALAGAWLGYLSLSTVGQDFLRFQWDGLLLEAGFVAILLAPWRWRSRLFGHAGDPPARVPRAPLWLARWLLFRLMLASAAVKLTSGDPTWHALTALDFHYFTQPLPPWTAWYASHLPAWFQKLSVLFMFACEGVAPFLLFGPRRARHVGVAAIAALQVLILLTGNYGFFNLLALALCVPALDDGVLSRLPGWTAMRGPEATPAPGPDASSPGGPDTTPDREPGGTAARTGLSPDPPRPPPGRARWPLGVVAAALFLTSLAPLSQALGVGTLAPRPLLHAYRFTSPLQLVNPYGLFAVMTTERPEIVVEGSLDGHEWQTYELRYKPGDPARRPAFTTPHMPRLDWQMWFAALGGPRQNPWFLSFCQRLLEGSPAVTSLLARDPFDGAPPRYVRAQLYRYRFTTAEERRRTGDWWARTLEGPYVPALTLVDGRLSIADDDATSP